MLAPGCPDAGCRHKQDRAEYHGAEHLARGGEGYRRHFANRHLLQQEAAAPDHRQRDEQAVVARTGLSALHGLHQLLALLVDGRAHRLVGCLVRQ